MHARIFLGSEYLKSDCRSHLFCQILHVSYFGEVEFWMSAVKLLVMLMLVLTCFVISVGGQPSGERIGFRYWYDPGAFGDYLVPGATGRLLGFWACMVQACFAYTGTELVGVAFGEAPNPRKTVGRAVRQTLWRIVAFYILGVLVLGMSVPYTDDRLVGATKASTSAAASPFVIAIQRANIPVLPDFVNACLLVFVLSSANSDVYLGSRTLFGLARDGQAPSIFRHVSRQGVPLYGVAVTALFTALGYMNVSKSASTVFTYLVSLVTVFATLNWVSCLVSYIQFTRAMKAQGLGRELLPYRGPLQPYGAYFSLVITCLVIFFNGMTVAPFHLIVGVLLQFQWLVLTSHEQDTTRSSQSLQCPPFSRHMSVSSFTCSTLLAIRLPRRAKLSAWKRWTSTRAGWRESDTLQIRGNLMERSTARLRSLIYLTINKSEEIVAITACIPCSRPINS